MFEYNTYNLQADGLYPNAPFFKICQDYGWDFIVSFKEGSLPSVRQEILALLPKNQSSQFQRHLRHGQRHVDSNYNRVSSLKYEGYLLTRVQCIKHKYGKEIQEKTICFEYVTNLDLSNQTQVLELVQTGRLRQKIENEGFNIQKKYGHCLKHKYSRKSVKASRNYYQCLQLAHLFEQLCFLEQRLRQTLRSVKCTLQYCFAEMIAALKYVVIDAFEILEVKAKRTQYRY